jgi:hypothetical protein
MNSTNHLKVVGNKKNGWSGRVKCYYMVPDRGDRCLFTILTCSFRVKFLISFPCSKWKWTSIATVPDICPTAVKILTHLISHYQLPLWETSPCIRLLFSWRRDKDPIQTFFILYWSGLIYYSAGNWCDWFPFIQSDQTLLHKLSFISKSFTFKKISNFLLCCLELVISQRCDQQMFI